MGRSALRDAAPNSVGPRSANIPSPRAAPRAAKSVEPRDEPQGLGPAGRAARLASPRSGGERGVEGGRVKGGAVQPRLPRGYLTAQQPQPRRRGATPQHALRTCPARGGPARDPGQLPDGGAQRWEHGKHVEGGGWEREHLAPGAPRRRPHVAVTPGAPPPNTPSPSHQASPPCPPPASAARARLQTPTMAPSHIHPGPTPPTCSHCRHPREGRGPDVRPVARGNPRV